MKYLLLFLLPLFAACASLRPHDARLGREMEREVTRSAVFAKAFTGFTLLDPATGKILADVNGNHYFTPASNTKILTLAACLQVLTDSVPGMEYFVEDSFLVFRGTADPTFLHSKFQHWQPAYKALAETKLIPLLYLQRLKEPRFGPGWAWDDYTEGFQAERTAFPIYGNTVRILGLKNGQFEVQPPFFRGVAQYPYHDEEFWIPNDIGRREGDNLIGMRRLPKEGEEIWIPFRRPYWEQMLADTLHHQGIDPAHYHIDFYEETKTWKTFFSIPLDTVLRRMMYESDNFVAEQMLLVCGQQKYGLLEQAPIISWMLDTVWADLPQRPRWVDGSGLSRYNLVSPQGLCQILQKLWRTQSHRRLLSLFPAGGVSGTIQDWYAGPDGKPYVFAKTGTLGGVHCLSGYVVGKSGRVLAFSFMHNNFVGSNRAWKAEMQRVLEMLRRNF